MLILLLLVLVFLVLFLLLLLLVLRFLEQGLEVGPQLGPVGGLRVERGAKVLLRDVDVDALRGEVLGVLGPSGAGKSTLLRCVNRLVEANGGSIEFDARLGSPALPDMPGDETNI